MWVSNLPPSSGRRSAADLVFQVRVKKTLLPHSQGPHLFFLLKQVRGRPALSKTGPGIAFHPSLQDLCQIVLAMVLGANKDLPPELATVGAKFAFIAAKFKDVLCASTVFKHEMGSIPENFASKARLLRDMSSPRFTQRCRRISFQQSFAADPFRPYIPQAQDPAVVLR